MICAWQAYLSLLPLRLRDDVDRIGQATLHELRLRVGRPPELVTGKKSEFLDLTVTKEDLNYCINAASRYSPWASTTISNGYITARGGHRMGICGDVAIVDGTITTIKNVTSVCVRVARDFPGIGIKAGKLQGSILILGAPGSGKTTLLRDIIRQKASLEDGAVAVVDERREVFPVASDAFCFHPGMRTEVMSGCNKYDGVQMLLRTMNPRYIAVDEITAEEDCRAMTQAAWCGVSLIATAHAGNLDEFAHRPVYKHLAEQGIFENVLVMKPDKSWNLERMCKCITN